MTLSDKIDSSEIIYFADPIHYNGSHLSNRTPVIKEGDFNFFKPYLKNWGKLKSKFYDEILNLSEIQKNKIYLFSGNYSIIVPDNILKNTKKLNNFFLSKDFLAGPQVNFSSGQYINFQGDDSMRLDIFGNQVINADFRFFANNRTYIGDSKLYKRHLSLEADDIDGCGTINESITIFEKKAKYILMADFDENGSYADAANYFDGGELNIAGGLIFVKDLDDNDEIQDMLMDWHEEYLADQCESWKYEESPSWSKVKYKNPFKLSSNETI